MKNLTFLTSLLAISSVVFLAACGDEVSDEHLDLQRQIANDNSRFNAQRWRGENGFEKLGILARGDSTQQKKCSQGDGWASVDLVDAVTKQPVIKLKCSTSSMAVGCVKGEDFAARAVLASQENSCNAGIPKVLKKIEN